MSHVIRIRRADDPAAFVIVHTKQNGPDPLDIRVVGTDGLSPFITELEQKSIQKLRSTKNPASDDEWTLVLSTILLQQDADPSVEHGLETVASVAEDESKISLTVRKNIGGITQRLGSITLDRNDEEELDIVQWAGIAAQRADDLRNRFTQLNSSLLSHQDTIQSLTAQLDALVLAKKAHEEELLKKFAALLNAKKLKIRDQQRLLAKAKVDPNIAEAVKQTRSTSPARKVGTSRASKRKAHTSPPHSETDDDEDFETAITGARSRKPAESSPEKSEPEETEDETDDEGFDPAPVASQASRRLASQSQTTKSSADTQKQAELTVEELAAQAPPPRRELPFTRKTANSQRTDTQPKQQSPKAAASLANIVSTATPDDDTESDDDEL